MPLDFNSYRFVTPQVQQPEGPLDIMQKVATLRDTQSLAQQRQALMEDRQQKLQQEAQDRQEQGQMQAVLAANQGDMEKSYPQLAAINAEKADKYLQAHLQNAELTNKLGEIDTQKQSTVAKYVTDQLTPVQNQHDYDVARAQIQSARALMKLPPASEQDMPAVYDPARVAQMVKNGQMTQDVLGKQQKGSVAFYTLPGDPTPHAMKVTPDGQVLWQGQDVREQAQPWTKEGADPNWELKDRMEGGKRVSYWVNPKTQESKLATGIGSPIPPQSALNIGLGAAPASTDLATLAKQAGMTVGALKNQAQILHEKGETPGFGMSGKNVKLAIMNAESVLYPEGSNLAATGAQFKADSASLKNIQGTLDSIQAFHPAALANLKQFDTLFSKIPDTGSPFFNQPVRSLDRKMFGADNVLAAQTAVGVATREIARITSNPRLTGQLSDSARKEVQDFIPGDATLKEAHDVMAVLKNDLDNVEKGQRDQLGRIQYRLAHPGETAPSDNAPPPGQPQQKPIPGIPGGVAELRNGRWIRVK